MTTKWVRFPQGATSVSHYGMEHRATHEGENGFWYAELPTADADRLLDAGMGFALTEPADLPSAEPKEESPPGHEPTQGETV